MAEVHSWQDHPDAHGIVRQAVEALSAGRLVVFPTETGPVVPADARIPQAVELLRGLPLAAETPLTLAVDTPAQAIAVLPGLPPLARRLARRCWPGPVTLLAANVSPNLSPILQPARDDHGRLWMRGPAHPAILTALRELNGPLLTGVPQGAEGLASLGEPVALVIDDGPCLYPDGETRVVVENDRWEVVRAGVVSADQVGVQLCCVVVFVCTGNTCRSPLAEALCKKRLAERLGCAVDELPRRGFLVLSAGVGAFPGDPAAEHAVLVARDYGADLAGHSSRSLNPELVFQADYLVCMTRSHLQALLAHYPELSCTPRLLSPEGNDLPDPIGQEETIYRECAAQVWTNLEALVRELLP